MFTGIIEEKGEVRSISSAGPSARLTVKAGLVLQGTSLGDSIAVNGVCLTVTDLSNDAFTADVMHETLDRSSLGSLRSGSVVNLERAMTMERRFGGHIVTGHIDGTGKITGIKKDGNAIWYTISAGPRILRYIIEKGSVALDGISLTVAAVTDRDFSVSVIPHTMAETNLSAKKAGDIINIENDCIGKYVEKLLEPYSGHSGITMDFLRQNGF